MGIHILWYLCTQMPQRLNLSDDIHDKVILAPLLIRFDIKFDAPWICI